MRNTIKLVALVVLASTMLAAQASRTWVSGVGDDANPCSRTAPCKTWAGAISKTAAGGEIDALDPGGFGAVTITKAITLDGGGGQVASVLVSGTNGIVVQAGANDVVIIRNMRINGIGSGINGVRFLSGKDLNLENDYIFGFTTNGVDVALNQGTAASVHIINCVIKNNGGVGISATNAVSPAVQVGIDHTSVMINTTGILAGANSRVVVTNSTTQNSSGTGTGVSGSGMAATNAGQITVAFSDSSFNVNGLTATATGSANTAFSNYAYNSSCGLNNNGAAGFATFGNNRFIGTTTCGTIGSALQQ
jgi:hypothetical protein